MHKFHPLGKMDSSPNQGKCSVVYCTNTCRHRSSLWGDLCDGCWFVWLNEESFVSIDEFKTRRAVLDLIMREIPSD